MKGRMIAAGLLGALALSACTWPGRPPRMGPVDDPSLEAGGTCNEAAARFLIGKTVDERIADTARVRAGARLVRVVRPGLPHDDDQRVSRLTLEVDEIGRVVAVSCR